MMAEDIQHNQKSNFNGLTKPAKAGASKKLIIKNFKGEFHSTRTNVCPRADGDALCVSDSLLISVG